MAQYYYLVASLNEYALDADTKGLDVPAVKEEVARQLTDRDRERLRELYAFYDVQNLVNMLDGRPAQFSALGNLSREAVARLAERYRASGKDRRREDRSEADGEAFPEPEMKGGLAFIPGVLEAYKCGQEAGAQTESDADGPLSGVELSKSLEYNLWSRYYARMERSSCRFLREWYAFDRDLRNIGAAFAARAQQREIAPELVGGGPVVEALARSNSADFGLKNEVDYVETLVQVLSLPNVLEKERRLDALRWQTADALTVFDYFGIDYLLGYLSKLNIIHRWMALDRNEGKKILEKLVAELTRNEALERFALDTGR